MPQHECSSCSFIYDPILGDRGSKIVRNTLFEDISVNWFCPLCSSDKSSFKKLDE